MVNNLILPMRIDLQLFAEGGGGAAAGGGAAGTGGTGAAEGTQSVATPVATTQRKGVKSNPLADVKYGVQPEDRAVPAAEGQATETVVAQPDRNAEFEKLIKGEYKDLYEARMRESLQKRFKGQQEITDKYNALTPTLEILAQKYGVEVGDIEALNKAIEEDDSYFEDEALEKGLTVEELKRIRKVERENAELKRQMEEQETRENANRLYSQWMQQEQETKGIYPSFSLEAEMQNPKFVDLLRSNIDVRTAYEVLHKDEIIPAAMQFTAKAVEQKIANKIIANGARPVENGMNSQGAAVVKRDPTQLTKADRAEVNRRVARGEIISFS